MSEDIQSLLEKINREGVEKAEAAAAAIVNEAKAKADALAKKAQEDAARAKADAEKSQAAYVARAKESLAQAARDTVIAVEASVKALLEKLLLDSVAAALADGRTAPALAAEAIAGLSGPGEIVCGPELAKALAQRLASGGAFTVSADEGIGPGFKVRLDGGRVETDFTAAAIAAELAKRLRPDLAALLK